MPYFDGTVQKGFILLVTSRAIRQVGGGLLGVFIPLFIYTLFDQNIYFVLYWYLVGYFLFVMLVIPGIQFLNKFGFRWGLIAGTIFISLFFVTLLFTTQKNLIYMIPLSLITVTLFRIFYWVPYHTDFTKFTDHRNRGREVGSMTATLALLGSIGPLIAGYIIVQGGFNILFIVAAILYFVSIIPLLSLPKTNEKFSWTYKETWKHFLSKEKRGMFLALGGIGAENVIAVVIWPIFIFELLQGNYFQVGIISTLIIGTTVTLQLLVGRYIDLSQLKKDRTLRVGSILYAIGWFIKIFVVTAFHIFLAGFYHGITKIFTMTPFDTLLYEIAADEGHFIDEFTVLREMAINIGKAVTVGLLVILLLLVSLQWTFIIAATASLLLNAVYFKNKDIHHHRQLGRGQAV